MKGKSHIASLPNMPNLQNYEVQTQDCKPGPKYDKIRSIFFIQTHLTNDMIPSSQQTGYRYQHLFYFQIWAEKTYSG